MDTPETLAAAMLRAAAAATATTTAVVTKGAQNVKNQARKNVRASAPTHNAGAAYAINYDVTPSPAGIEAEIGYDKDDKRGRIGNLLEFGGGGDKSPPHRDLGRALDDEEKRFPDALAAAIEKLL
jgi:hypothetical protein